MIGSEISKFTATTCRGFRPASRCFAHRTVVTKRPDTGAKSLGAAASCPHRILPLALISYS